MNAFTDGTLLGGRVRYRQPADGYRTGVEPVLLAACVPARAGETVLEAGTGAGAGLLCLMARVPGLRGLAVELDPALAALARHNLVANGLDATVTVQDVVDAGALGPVNHAYANPPWHDPRGTAPGHPARVRAKQLPAGLEGWIGGLAAAVGPGGTLSLCLPPGMLPESLRLLQAAGFRSASLMPLWSRQGRQAKLTLLQARHASGRFRLLPGMVLHDGQGFTAEADSVLRGGDALPL